MKITFKTIIESESFVAMLLEEKKYAIEVTHLDEEEGFEVQWIEYKQYAAQDGKFYPDEIWTKENGDMVNIQDLEPEHARNIIRLILRREHEMNEGLRSMLESYPHVMGDVPAENEPEQKINAEPEFSLPINSFYVAGDEEKPTLH